MNDRVWPSQATIGRDTNMSEPTVRKALRELTEAGFIRPRRLGQGHSNEYLFNFDALDLWAQNGSFLRTEEHTSFGRDRRERVFSPKRGFGPDRNGTTPEDPPRKDLNEDPKVEALVSPSEPTTLAELDKALSPIVREPARTRILAERARALRITEEDAWNPPAASRSRFS
jgi:hypothetical protein